MAYVNLANAEHPATLIYLVDISKSMEVKMSDGRTRIDVTKDAIQNIYTAMIQRSLRQGKIRPRYRVGMIAYSDKLHDVYGKSGSILTIDKISDEGVPAISPQKTTEMAKAFRYAAHLIQEDLKGWSKEWLDKCPPPMVINITDCEISDDTEAPLPYVNKLREISTPDGNVLVENIFITDEIKLPSGNVLDWHGYLPGGKTGDIYGDKILEMSSPIPKSYSAIMEEQASAIIPEGAAMMFPGISSEFVKTGFVMSIATGVQVDSKRTLYSEK